MAAGSPNQWTPPRNVTTPTTPTHTSNEVLFDIFAHPRHSNGSLKPRRVSPAPIDPSIHPTRFGFFQDPKEIPTQIPHAREVLSDLYKSDTDGESIISSETEIQIELSVHVTRLTNYVHTMVKKVKQLEIVARHTAKPPPAGYNNDPAVGEKVAILTTKFAKLESWLF